MATLPIKTGRILEALAAAPAPAPASREPEWESIDPASLPKALAAAYDLKRKADAAAREAREAFETAFKSALPAPGAGMEYKFGYRFGQLAVCAAPIETAKPKKGALSFAALAKR